MTKGSVTDVFDEGDASVPPDQLAKVIKTAEETLTQEAIVADLETSLSSAKARLNHLRSGVLPDMMAEAGLTEFRLATGERVKINDYVSGSLPKEEDNPAARRKALDWLEHHREASRLIKTVVEVRFGRTEHNRAVDLAERLSEEGLDVSVMSGVHPQTLMAFARECLREGAAIPLETLGLHAGRVAKIEAPKEPKTKTKKE